jgi:Baseplate J-like protein
MTDTAVPPIQFTDTGLVLPQESDILAGAQADIDAAFGGGLNPALNTPQGQLASSLSAIVSNTNDLFAEFVNQVDPDTNDGFMQDAIARIYFLNRSPGAPTAVQCDCVGALGTVIPVGAQAADQNGNRYVCTEGGTIDVTGTISLSFANIVNGPIACPANQLNIIYQAIPGWNTINNPLDGVPGQNVETAAAFRQRRAQSVALNAHGSLVSIYAAVFNLPDVIDVYATENDTNTTVNTGSTAYPLVPHSLYVAVVGGNAADIANAIWTKKDVGCDYNGNTSVVVTDPSGYLPPVPQYTVKFEIPPSLPIKFAVQIANSASLPANIVALTKAAIIASFNGTDGSTRVRIASLLLASKFYAGVVAIGPEVSVLSILLGSVTPTLTSQQIGIDQAPTVQASDITVTLV